MCRHYKNSVNLVCQLCFALTRARSHGRLHWKLWPLRGPWATSTSSHLLLKKYTHASCIQARKAHSTQFLWWAGTFPAGKEGGNEGVSWTKANLQKGILWFRVWTNKQTNKTVSVNKWTKSLHNSGKRVLSYLYGVEAIASLEATYFKNKNRKYSERHFFQS